MKPFWLDTLVKTARENGQEELIPTYCKNSLWLQALCRKHVAGYKVPAHYHFTDEIPRNPSGKVLKQQLRNDIGKDYDQ